MIFNRKDKIKEIEHSIENLRTVTTIQTTSIASIAKALENINKRIKLQQEMILSLSKQLDILANSTLFKEADKLQQILNEKPKLIKVTDEHPGSS